MSPGIQKLISNITRMPDGSAAVTYICMTNDQQLTGQMRILISPESEWMNVRADRYQMSAKIEMWLFIWSHQ